MVGPLPIASPIVQHQWLLSNTDQLLSLVIPQRQLLVQLLTLSTIQLPSSAADVFGKPILGRKYIFLVVLLSNAMRFWGCDGCWGIYACDCYSQMFFSHLYLLLPSGALVGSLEVETVQVGCMRDGGVQPSPPLSPPASRSPARHKFCWFDPPTVGEIPGRIFSKSSHDFFAAFGNW